MNRLNTRILLALNDLETLNGMMYDYWVDRLYNQHLMIDDMWNEETLYCIESEIIHQNQASGNSHVPPIGVAQ